jgi:hypothetical protein
MPSVRIEAAILSSVALVSGIVRPLGQRAFGQELQHPLRSEFASSSSFTDVRGGGSSVSQICYGLENPLTSSGT